MGTMLNRLREYLNSATPELLEATHKELSEFLSTGPLVTEYLEALPQMGYNTIDYTLANPEYNTLDFSF